MSLPARACGMPNGPALRALNGMSGELTMPEILGPASRCSITTTTAISTCSLSGTDARRRQSAQPGAVSAANALPLSGRGCNRNDLNDHAGRGTLHFTGRHPQSNIGLLANGLRDGVADRRLRQRRLVDLYLTASARASCSNNNGDGTFGPTCRKKRDGDRRLDRGGDSPRLRPRGGSTLRRKLPALQRRGRDQMLQSIGPRSTYCTPNSYRPAAGAACFTTTGTARSPTSRHGLASPANSVRALGVATSDFNGNG